MKAETTTETPMTIPVKRKVCRRVSQVTLLISLLTSLKKTGTLWTLAEKAIVVKFYHKL